MARKHHTVGQRFIPYRTFVGAMIPNNLMRFKGLSATAKLVWGRLAQYAGRDGLCHPSYKTLGAECGISKRQAISIIKELISKEFIEKTVSTDRERQRGLRVPARDTG